MVYPSASPALINFVDARPGGVVGGTRDRKLQFSNKNGKFLTEKIMGAQNYNFCF